PSGQQWTTLVAMQEEYHNVIKPTAPGLTGIGTHPSFAIGQRALLVQTSAGDVLWDCITPIDDPTIAAVKALGGVAAIAIPLPAGAIRRIVAAVEPYPFDRPYGGWWDRIVAPDAKGAVTRSAERYIARISGQ